MKMIVMVLFTFIGAGASAEMESVSMFDRSEVVERVSELLKNSQLTCTDGSAVSSLIKSLDSAHSVRVDHAAQAFNFKSSCCGRSIYAGSEVNVLADGSHVKNIQVKYEQLIDGKWITTSEVICR